MVVAGPPGAEGSSSAIVHDPFDAEAFDQIAPRSPGLQILLDEGGYPRSRELAFDLFCSFYKYFVKLVPPERIEPAFRSHRDLLSRALDLKEHAKLRAFTRLKAVETVLATEIVLDALLKEIRRKEAEQSKAAASGEEPEEERPPTEAGLEVSTERLQAVLREAREDLAATTELIATWSAGPGQETRLPSDLKLRLMRDLIRNPRLARIAQLFGRYRRLGVQQRELRALLASEEVVDFVQGGDVARALAGELSNFAMEEREDLFYAKLVTRQLLIYELWRRKPEPRPVYLCIDNSGSMAGEKEVWAKSTALALAHMAIAQGRTVEIVLFGDVADPLRVIPLRREDDASTRLLKVMDVASYFLGGGTDFVKPLSHVLEMIEDGGHRGSDILFISDGLCPIPEAFANRFLDAKSRHDIRLTSVVIGGEPLSLGPISDSLHRLEENLESGEDLAAQFAATFLERAAAPGPRPRGGRRAGRHEPLVFDHFLPEEP